MISVIVCTYNRAAFLKTCLESLLTQSVATELFEVVVVNNNSNDTTAEVAALFQSEFPRFVYVEESRQGLSYARNAGVQAATGDWVAFLDDDAVARTNWVATLIETSTKGDFDVFGGVYTAWHALRERPKWFSPEWETNVAVASEYSVLKEGYPSGGNCAYRRALLLEGDGFPTNLGMKGNGTAYGEETAVIDRLRTNGAVVGFVPDMIIDHCVIDRKYSLGWRLKRSFATGRDTASLWKENSAVDLAKPVIKCVYYLLSCPLKVVWLFLARRDYYWQNAVLDLFSGIMLNLGRIAGGIQSRFQG